MLKEKLKESNIAAVSDVTGTKFMYLVLFHVASQGSSVF